MNYLLTLAQWKEAADAAEKVKPIIALEQALRRKLVAELAAALREAGTPLKEGTNNVPLANDWKLKVVTKIERDVDEAALPAVKEKLLSLGVDPERFVRYTAELVVKEYRVMTDEQRSVLDQALTAKPGSPTVELLPPKGT